MKSSGYHFCKFSITSPTVLGGVSTCVAVPQATRSKWGSEVRRLEKIQTQKFTFSMWGLDTRLVKPSWKLLKFVVWVPAERKDCVAGLARVCTVTYVCSCQRQELTTNLQPGSHQNFQVLLTTWKDCKAANFPHCSRGSEHPSYCFSLCDM